MKIFLLAFFQAKKEREREFSWFVVLLDGKKKRNILRFVTGVK